MPRGARSLASRATPMEMPTMLLSTLGRATTTSPLRSQVRGRALPALAILALVASLFAGVPARPVAAAADPPSPVVAIHVSEHTAALETMTATPPTPTGPGYTGKEWWFTTWRYFVAYQSLEEALKADGTPYVEVSDADIAAGKLLTADGAARYPIVFSLAAEAIADNEIAPLRGYVSAGGFLMVGSSSFTRNPNGTTRGSFALQAEMGLRSTTAVLNDWTLNDSFTKSVGHRLTADLPSGILLWGGKQSADTTPWSSNTHWVWRVTGTDAQVLATGDGGVELATKAYGAGRFIYDAELQPLLGDTGYSSSTFAYAIYRRAVEWAFEAAGMPIVKVSPWQYPYDAAGMVRHDLEASRYPGSTILSSAQYEQGLGMKGDYYFTTGTLRISPTNPDTRMSDAEKKADIDKLRAAVSTYGATVGSHNGGLTNPAGYPTPLTDANAHTMWHWGPDEALDLSPAGYPSGYAYAQQSVQISFQDIETWMSSSPYAGATGLARPDNGRSGCGAAGTCPRTFVGPYHNAGREGSHQILGDLGAQVVGEQKVGPFPIRDFSYLAPHTYFPMVGMSVGNWYIGTTLQESLDGYLGTADMRAAVDWYYDLGGLVNLYGHSALAPYVAYLAGKPNLWKTNAVGIRDWSLRREPVTVTPSFTRSGSTWAATATVSGSTDSLTAVELVIPSWSGTTTGISVLLNGAAAPAGTWRATAYGVKIKVGTTVSSVEVDYVPVTSGATYHSLTPARLLDTRVGTGLSGVFTSGTPRSLAVTGHAGVPAGAIAVTGNLTVTNQTSPGFVALTTVSTPNPATSTLNFPLGDNRANGVTAPLGAGGVLWATYRGEAGGATTDLLFDVTGYFLPDATGATYVSLTPARLLDTRVGTGLSGVFTSGTPRSLAVTGHAGVPAGAIAVTGNLTVTNQTSPGFVALTTVSTPNPATSTLNFPLGDNRANGVTAPLGAGGVLWATYRGEAGGATTDLLFDVTGYFLPDATGATYVSLTPARLLDTRVGTGLSGVFTSGTPRSLAVTGHAGVPAGAIAVTGNLTVTNQTSPGFVALTTVSTPNPATSTLNFPLGDNRANGVTAPLGAGGVLWATYRGEAGGATTDLLFDVTGYFLP